MSDDIVTRLRYQRTNSVLCAEAADEIERLRKQVAEWKDLASEYYHLDPKCECHLCDRFREAINNGDR